MMKLIFENWREYLTESPEDKPVSVDDIHNRADKLGIPWDDDADFMSWTKELTGESHLDNLTDEDLSKVYASLESRSIEEKVDKDKMPCNKPRTTDSHKGKSHVVKACEDGKEKIIPFGEKGASTAGKPKKGESEKMKKKRKSFKARHAKNIKKGKMSAAYWANKVKW